MRQGESISARDVKFLPIISAYARTLGLVEEVDRLCGSKRGVSDGKIVLALILDALSGRSPLFRLPQAFAKLDTELLLGEAIASEKLNDDAVGRALDRIFEVGTGKVLSAVALRAVKLFDLETSHVHYDTTSRSVYGDYDLYGAEPCEGQGRVDHSQTPNEPLKQKTIPEPPQKCAECEPGNWSFLPLSCFLIWQLPQNT